MAGVELKLLTSLPNKISMKEVWLAEEAEEYELTKRLAASCPPAFLCPISLDIMVEPVTLVETGQTYEKMNIRKWFTMGGDTCPLTGIRLKTTTVMPDGGLQQRITRWVASKGLDSSCTVPERSAGQEVCALLDSSDSIGGEAEETGQSRPRELPRTFSNAAFARLPSPLVTPRLFWGQAGSKAAETPAASSSTGLYRPWGGYAYPQTGRSHTTAAETTYTVQQAQQAQHPQQVRATRLPDQDASQEPRLPPHPSPLASMRRPPTWRRSGSGAASVPGEGMRDTSQPGLEKASSLEAAFVHRHSRPGFTQLVPPTPQPSSSHRAMAGPPPRVPPEAPQEAPPGAPSPSLAFPSRQGDAARHETRGGLSRVLGISRAQTDAVEAAEKNLRDFIPHGTPGALGRASFRAFFNPLAVRMPALSSSGFTRTVHPDQSPRPEAAAVGTSSGHAAHSVGARDTPYSTPEAAALRRTASEAAAAAAELPVSTGEGKSVSHQAPTVQALTQTLKGMAPLKDAQMPRTESGQFEVQAEASLLNSPTHHDIYIPGMDLEEIAEPEQGPGGPEEISQQAVPEASTDKEGSDLQLTSAPRPGLLRTISAALRNLNQKRRSMTGARGRPSEPQPMQESESSKARLTESSLPYAPGGGVQGREVQNPEGIHGGAGFLGTLSIVSDLSASPQASPDAGSRRPSERCSPEPANKRPSEAGSGWHSRRGSQAGGGARAGRRGMVADHERRRMQRLMATTCSAAQLLRSLPRHRSASASGQRARRRRSLRRSSSEASLAPSQPSAASSSSSSMEILTTHQQVRTGRVQKAHRRGFMQCFDASGTKSPVGDDWGGSTLDSLLVDTATVPTGLALEPEDDLDANVTVHHFAQEIMAQYKHAELAATVEDQQIMPNWAR